MAAQGNRVLISYNDSSKDPQNRDAVIAEQLANHLFRNRMYPEIREYSQSRINNQPPCDYDWLILVYSPEARKSPVSQTVENALDLTVKRRMRGVLAITPGPAELPPEWATIRKYDASSVDWVAVGQALSYAKTPYTKEKLQELDRNNQPRPTPSVKFLVLVTLAAITALFVILTPFYILFTQSNASQGALTSSDLTATAQGYNGILTATMKNVRASATTEKAQATATAAAPSIAQKQFTTITKPLPKFTGFQKDEKWDQNTSCILGPQSATYEATVVTPGQYVRCMATASNLKNFAYQVTMNISGDAGGVIFRSVEQTSVFYRFSVTPGSGEFAVILCQSDCTTNTVGEGTLIAGNHVHVDPNQAITLTVIAKDTLINLYVNGNFVDQLTDKLASPGVIGVYAASISTPTTVTFTNPKVWPL